MSRYLSGELPGVLGQGCKVIGPYSPAVDRIGGENIRIIRILLPKDIHLKSNKAAISGLSEKFEKEKKYIGHIALDVDPV